MEKQKRKGRPRQDKENAAPIAKKDLKKKGDKLEEDLDKLDEIIDQVLAETEEDSELRAQRFVDGFKQEGGE